MTPINKKCLGVSNQKAFESKAEFQEPDIKRWIGLNIKAREKVLNITNDSVGQKGRMCFSLTY